jgi:hypothetical protein
MDFIKTNSNLIIIALLTVLIIRGFAFSGDGTNTIETIIKTDSVFVTLPTERIEFKTVNTKTVYVPQQQIENSTIERYYYDTSKNVSRETLTAVIETKDTIKNDDGEFRITTLSENPILLSRLDYDLSRLEITETVTNTVNPKHLFFVGGGVAKYRNEVGLFGSVQYQNNNNKAVQYSFDPFRSVHRVSVLVKIR